MWILHNPDSEAGPITFRVFPGATKTVGRAPRADFILEAALVSRLHCRLEAGEHSLEVLREAGLSTGEILQLTS